MKKFLLILTAIFSFTYPFIIYFGVQRVSPAFFAIILFALAVMKFIATKDKKDIFQLLVLVFAIGFSVILAVTNSELLLRLYPVVMSIAVGLVFASSLRQEENILLRMARAAGKKIGPEATNYTRKLTSIWVALLFSNALIALYFAIYGTLFQWAFYSGFLCYALFAGFFLIELVYRHFYIARHSPKPE
jgi:uncharacterized membrane protein